MAMVQIREHVPIELFHGMRTAGLAPATANRVVIVMRYMYNLGKKWLIAGAETNPAAGIQLLEVNNAREQYLTAEETQRLVQVLQGSDNPQLKFIVPLLLLTGTRKRELLDSKWEDFDLVRRSWRFVCDTQPEDTEALCFHILLVGYGQKGCRDAGLGVVGLVPVVELGVEAVGV